MERRLKHSGDCDERSGEAENSREHNIVKIMNGRPKGRVRYRSQEEEDDVNLNLISF